MKNAEHLILSAAAIVIMLVIANIAAQSLYPTFLKDSGARRISYRMLVGLCLIAEIGICMIGLVILDAMGYKL